MATTPFDSLDDYLSQPRIEALALSPDGTRAVLTVATLGKDGTAYERSLWEVPVDGDGAPVRLTRSAKGETGAAFTSRGDVLFVSARPDTEAEEDAEQAQLWLLPAAGGEARPVTRLAGGVAGVTVAEAADVLVLGAPLLPSSDSSKPTRGCGPHGRSSRSRRSCTTRTRCGSGTTTSVPPRLRCTRST